jgi:aspartate racemase
MKKLGLVGGTSWVSTIDYYRLINEGVNERLGGLNYAELIIYSVNFNDFQRNNTAGNWDATYELLLDACKRVIRGGAEAIVLCANTSHAVADKLEAVLDVPIIHIVTATANEIKRLGLKKVGLMGTKFTMEMDFYKNILNENGIECIVPEPVEKRDAIQKTVKEELGRGIIKEETKQQYITYINEMIERGAEGIILGCTELPMILSQQDIKVPVFDTTQIHSKAAVDFILS